MTLGAEQMDFIRAAWNLLPDSDAKCALRMVAQNYKQRGRAHFSRLDDAYIVDVYGLKLMTTEPPFQAANYIDHFQARHRVTGGEVVIEGGTFWGIFTSTLALQVGPEGRVLAFEPDSINFKRTLQNLQLNANPAHVEVVCKGLWNCESELEFCERGALGSSAFWDGPNGHKVTIQTISLDKAVFDRNLSRVDYIKMNIEGAEIKALEGADEVIRRFRPHFAISSDHYLDGDISRQERTCGSVERILTGYGYSVQTLKYGTEWVTYGTP